MRKSGADNEKAQEKSRGGGKGVRVFVHFNESVPTCVSFQDSGSHPISVTFL